MSCGDGEPVIYRNVPWNENIPLRPEPGSTLDITGFFADLTLKNRANPDWSLTLSTTDGTLEIYEPIGNSSQDALIVTRCPQEDIGALPVGDYDQELRIGQSPDLTVIERTVRYIRDGLGEDA